MTINLIDLSVVQLKRAAQIKEQITKLQNELSSVFGSILKAPAKSSGMSAAAKARLSAMAKARWAKIKASGKKSF